ncbi:MAG: multidrug effflux MFS transporter [Pseudomonadota bacterium]
MSTNPPTSAAVEPLPGLAPTVPSVVLLGIASGLSPFGMAVLVPALDSIASHFGRDFLQVQFVLSAYLLGLAVAQPVCGFLCDRYGRRPVMLTGFAVFVAASVLCAAAWSLEVLIAGRFLQAVGVSVGTVASRAVLRDTREPNELAEGMSYIAAIMGVAPVVAPIIGGFVDGYTSFVWIFLISAVLGVLVLRNMLLRLPETLDPQRPPPRWRDWLRSYAELLRSPKFLGYTLAFGFVQGSFFGFMAVGAAFFSARFGIGAAQFGTLWGGLAIAYVGGAWLAARATPRFGSPAVVGCSVLGGLVAGVLLLLLNVVGEPTPVRIAFPLGLLMVTSGITTPGAMAGALAAHPVMAGTASGLSSALGLVTGGAFTVIAGAIYQGAFEPVAWLMFGACAATAVSWWVGYKAQS